MSPYCRRAVGIAALLVVAGLTNAAQHGARADEKEEFKKTCIASQVSAAENQKLSSATIVRYCNCVTKHTFEVIAREDFARAGPSGKIPPDVQRKLNAVGE